MAAADPGACDGAPDGATDGAPDGATDGAPDGAADGAVDGAAGLAHATAITATASRYAIDRSCILFPPRLLRARLPSE